MESHSVLPPANHDHGSMMSYTPDTPALSEFTFDINLLPQEMWLYTFSLLPHTEFTNLTLALPKAFKIFFDDLLRQPIVALFSKWVERECNNHSVIDDGCDIEFKYRYSGNLTEKIDKETALRIYENFHNQILAAAKEVFDYDKDFKLALQKMNELTIQFAEQFIQDKSFANIYQHILTNEHVLTLWSFNQFLPVHYLKQLNLVLPRDTHLIAAAKGKVFLLEYLLSIGFTLDVVHKQNPLVWNLKKITPQTVESPLSLALITNQNKVVDFILNYDVHNYYTQATLYSALAEPNDELNQIVLAKLSELNVKTSDTYLFNTELPKDLTAHDLSKFINEIQEGKFLTINHLINLIFTKKNATKGAIKVLISHLAKSPAWDNYFFSYMDYLSHISIGSQTKLDYQLLYVFYEAHRDKPLWWQKQIKNLLNNHYDINRIFIIQFAIKSDPIYFNKTFWFNFFKKNFDYISTVILLMQQQNLAITPTEANKILFDVIKYQPNISNVYQQDLNKLVSILLELGVNLNALDEQGYTPLMLLVRLGCPQFARAIVRNGANKDIQHKDTKLTALAMLDELDLSKKVKEAFKRLLINEQPLHQTRNYTKKESKSLSKSEQKIKEKEAQIGRKRKANTVITTIQTVSIENAKKNETAIENNACLPDLVITHEKETVKPICDTTPYHSRRKRSRSRFRFFDTSPMPIASDATPFSNLAAIDITFAQLAELNNEGYNSLRRSLLPFEEEGLSHTNESGDWTTNSGDSVAATFAIESDSDDETIPPPYSPCTP